jgi:Tfp pilus assembly protein PilN
MIRINLLPPELRSAAGTPVKVFVGFLCGLGLICVLLCTYAYLWFDSVVVQERLDRKRDEFRQLSEKASEVDSLLDDIAAYKEREQVIINIKTSRVLWSKKLDDLFNITPGHIWITRLDMRELDPTEYNWEEGRTQTGGYLKLKCFSSGSDVDRMTSYRKRLKQVDEFYSDFMAEPVKPDNFYSDFVNITPPEWSFVVLTGYQEPKNIRFSVRLDLRPLAERPDQPNS